MKYYYNSKLENSETTKKTYKNMLIKHISMVKFSGNTEKAIKWCKTNNPIIIFKNIEEKKEMLYSYNEGYIGDQLMLI